MCYHVNSNVEVDIFGQRGGCGHLKKRCQVCCYDAPVRWRLSYLTYCVYDKTVHKNIVFLPVREYSDSPSGCHDVVREIPLYFHDFLT